MSSPQYLQRVIDVEINIGLGTNGEQGKETIRFYGARVLTEIQVSGSPGSSFATIRIFGLSLDHMNKISSLGLVSSRVRQNTITVMAGDAVNGKPVVFIGQIQEAFGDFNAMPDVCFTVNAQFLLLEKMRPISPTSYAGAVDVATIISGLATQINYTLENNGVSVILPNPYFWGTAIKQIEDASHAANVHLCFDDRNFKVAIWPQDGSRGGVIPLISPATGMIGYPDFVSNGISFRVFYNPSLQFGGMVQISSNLTAACGYWIINALSHRLESQQIGGAWFSDVQAYRLGNPNPNIAR